MHRKSFPRQRDRTSQRPPRLAEFLLLLVTPAPERDGIAGDLEEEFHLLRASRGSAHARRWYRRQVARSLAPGLKRPRPPRPRVSASGRAAGPEQRILSTDGLRHDVGWALRGLARARGFTAISILTLALAIGVNSAIFSMISVIIFNDFPVTDTATFSFFYVQNPQLGTRRRQMSMVEFLEYREGVSALEQMVAIRDAKAILTGGEEPVRVTVSEATPELWESWGTPPFLGRGFRHNEAVPGAEPVVLLSHGFWERRFGSDAEIVGKRIRLDGAEAMVVGVMSPAFEFADMSQVEVWRPLQLPSTATPSSQRDLFVTGRLAPGATLAQARLQADAVAERLAQESPRTYGGWIPQVESFTEGLASDDFWPIIALLMITVGFVMLMACSNIASMMLARGSARSREIAVRAALGAGRLRIIRGLLAEGAILALAAALLGLAVARASLAALVWIAGETANVSFFFRMLEIDRSVLVFTLLVAVLSPILFSLLPAVRVTRTSIVDTLKQCGSHASGGIGGLRVRRILVGGQVALALSLTVVAGVLMRSLVEVRAMDLGYDARTLLTMRVDLPEAKYDGEERRQQFFRDALEQVRALPDVDAAGWVSRRPIAESPGRERFRIRGRDEDPGREPSTGLVAADPAYLALVNVRLLRGRMFDPQDNASSLPVVLVNQDVVTRYWPDENPVGQHVQLTGGQADTDWMEIVGVVSALGQPDPTAAAAPLFYVPLEQSPRTGLALVVRPRDAAREAADAIRRAVWAVDPDQPIADVRTMQQIFNDGIAPVDAVTAMLSAFAGFALVMAAAGIYGVMSVLVSQRAREFGVRMALGADPRAVRSMVIRGSAWLVIGGAFVGVLVGYALATFLASGFPEVEAADPVVYATVTITLIAVSFASLWLPTRRATKVDPLIAFRAE